MNIKISSYKLKLEDNLLKRKRNKMDNIDNEEYNSKKILDINETIYFNFIQSSDSLFSNNKNLLIFQ